jgi:hypothetical protein
VPEAQRVFVTAHEDEELEEAFWFAQHRAIHPAHDLNTTLILHIADARAAKSSKPLTTTPDGLAVAAWRRSGPGNAEAVGQHAEQLRPFRWRQRHGDGGAVGDLVPVSADLFRRLRFQRHQKGVLAGL